MTSQNPTERPLDGVRVLDLSRVLAGPLCAQWLGDLGASVIKVEAAELGDETRGWPPLRDGHSTVNLSANRNKLGIAVNLKHPDGRAIVRRLAASSDVVIENFGEATARRLGVSYEDLKPANPAMVYCAISGFGRTGPMRDAPAYDVVLQALTGFMSLTGEPGGAPIRSPFSPVDQTTGVFALSGITAALYKAARTGKGSFVEVSLFETAIALLSYQLQGYWETGRQPEKNGSTHRGMCPYQVFEASDGPFLLAISNDAQWSRFCEAAGAAGLADDPRFRSNKERVARYEETAALVQGLIAGRTATQWTEALAAVRVPCAPVNDFAALMALPQTAARDVIANYDHPDLGSTRAVVLPIKIDDEPRGAGTPPPRHGADSRDVLTASGFDDAEIERLARDGIIVCGHD